MTNPARTLQQPGPFVWESMPGSSFEIDGYRLVEPLSINASQFPWGTGLRPGLTFSSLYLPVAQT